MVVRQSNEPEPSTELRPLNHNDFFTNTFQMKRLAKGFLRVTLPGELRKRLDLDGLSIEPTHLTDDVFKNRHADVVYRVPIIGTEHYVDFFVILEHKSRNDLWAIFQLWQYVALVLRLEYKNADDEGRVNSDYRLPPVIAIIVHHGESRFTGKTELSELFLQLPGLEKYLPRLQAVLFDLNAIADEDVPFDPEVPELKLVLTALKVVFRKDVTTKIAEIIEELKPISDDPVVQDVIRTVWHYLVWSATYMEERYEILFETINKVVEVDAMPTMIEKAVVQDRAKMVLAALEKKFKQIPMKIEESVLAMSDPIALKSLLEHAIDSNTLDEFAEALM